jgi:hypothetical protein
MNTRYIDSISSYCDRWCERCAFTARCSAFAAEAAIAMCGDVEEGLELAVGRPAQVPHGPARPADPVWLGDFDKAEMRPDEQLAFEREERARRARIDENAIVKAAWAVSMLAYQWLKAKADALRVAADPVLNEALTVATHDSFLVTVKVTRAVDGHDRFVRGEDRDEGVVQNDWNGSAKLALICLARSAEAWHVIAEASGDAASREIAEQMRALARDVEEAFPHAHRFVRPGFDEMGV